MEKQEIINYLFKLREQKKITREESLIIAKSVRSLYTKEDVEYFVEKEKNRLESIINDHRVLNTLGRNLIFTKEDLINANLNNLVKAGPKTLEKIKILKEALQNLNSAINIINN